MEDSSVSDSTVPSLVGSGPLQFMAHAHWERLPPDYRWSEVAGVATDRHDRVFVFNRGPHPVIVFAADGTFECSWGEGEFVRPHGISIAPDDTVYCTDDADHTVKQFTADGRLLKKFGASGQPSNTGATSVDYRTIRRAGEPFHFPTNVAFAGDEIYIADGYGNARIHRFAADGRQLQSWGEPGSGPGQFHIPHGIAVGPDGNVYVADRENSRIQIFSPTGEYLDEWADVARPCQIAFDHRGLAYVAELGYRAGMWPGTSPPAVDSTGGRLSIFDPQGNLLARWGGGLHPTAAGDFFAPHDVCIDSRGSVYVAEVVMSAGGNRGLVAADCHSLQKFTPCG